MNRKFHPSATVGPESTVAWCSEYVEEGVELLFSDKLFCFAVVGERHHFFREDLRWR